MYPINNENEFAGPMFKNISAIDGPANLATSRQGRAKRRTLLIFAFFGERMNFGSKSFVGFVTKLKDTLSDILYIFVLIWHDR